VIGYVLEKSGNYCITTPTTEVRVQLNDEFFRGCVSAIKKKLEEKCIGKPKFGEAVDAVLNEKLPKMMSAPDRLRFRDLIVTEMNQEMIESIGEGRKGKVVMVGRFKSDPRHCGRDLAAGAGVEERNEELHPPEPQGAA
jgi:hypothetical protein